MGNKKLKSLLDDLSKPKQGKVYDETLKLMKHRGSFIYTREHEAFFYDSRDKKIYPILDKKFLIWLSIEFGFVTSERIIKHVVSRLETHAFQNGKEIEFKKFSHYDPAVCVLYINKFDGKVFRIDGEQTNIVDMGTDDIYFNDSDYDPIGLAPSNGLMDKILFGDINFSNRSLNREEQKFIFKWWFFASFFKTIFPAKPILVLYGDPNSGKTVSLKRFPLFLFGSKGDVNSPPDLVRDLRVIANHSHILLLDDIEPKNKNLESELVRMATGVRVDERKLYTNKGLSSLVPDAFVAITTKAPHFTREDLIQRTFVLWLESKTDNINPNVLQQRILDNRSKLWSEVLSNLLSIVKRLKDLKNQKPIEVRFRNAAWAEFVFKATHKKYHNTIKKLLNKINEDQIMFLLESNPLAKALFLWLREKGNLGKWIESGELRQDLMRIARLNQLDQTIYKNNQKYGVELKNVVSTFSRIYEVEINRPRGRNEYYFRKKR